MAFTMERWYYAVGQRFSVRKYAGAPTQDEIETLTQRAEELSVRGVRIVLAENKKAFAPMLLGAGRIKGTGWFAGFISQDVDPRTVGYLGQAFVLECTAMGLGTCWLGMHNKKAARNSLEMNGDEYLACITPIGAPAEPYAPRPRKPLNALAGLDQQALQALPEWQQYALECARRAPSATNAQPWEFIVEGETICVRNVSGNFGFGMLDCGIAMLHMELGAAHGGVAGDWAFDGKDAVFTPTSYEN